MFTIFKAKGVSQQALLLFNLPYISLRHFRNFLVGQGDMMATTLTWLNDVPAGGGTAFDAVAYEDVIQPTKGYQF